MVAKKNFGIVIALMSILSAAPAHAEFFNNASTNGGSFSEDIFFGGALGQAEAENYCQGASSCNDTDTTWKIYGGYTINEVLDAEVTYQSVGDVNRVTDDGTETSEVSAFSFSATGKYKINETVDAIGKIGATRWSSDNSDDDESGFGLNYGFGLKVEINENMKLRAEWENISGVETTGGNDSDITTLSIGIELKTL